MSGKRPNCKGCKYHRHISSGLGNFGCHYMLDTGEQRGYTPEECGKKKIHYVKGARRKPKGIVIAGYR